MAKQVIAVMHTVSSSTNLKSDPVSSITSTMSTLYSANQKMNYDISSDSYITTQSYPPVTSQYSIPPSFQTSTSTPYPGPGNGALTLSNTAQPMGSHYGPMGSQIYSDPSSNSSFIYPYGINLNSFEGAVPCPRGSHGGTGIEREREYEKGGGYPNTTQYPQYPPIYNHNQQQQGGVYVGGGYSTQPAPITALPSPPLQKPSQKPQFSPSFSYPQPLSHQPYGNYTLPPPATSPTLSPSQYIPSEDSIDKEGGYYIENNNNYDNNYNENENTDFEPITMKEIGAY
eukprot:CAMPEP_0182425706 /NCGR_PEP_ID=MMETSP1167-20130531/12190_1 /TAXON_ID=2988 /ORGANISM="Mallomonas Sp, Strain CCMP3275" /LENGTH=284 /DNA_ID=CAMNT_0024606639 /DNA_START=62 /DNA_END=913 /DNA_ORIENTATION=+